MRKKDEWFLFQEFVASHFDDIDPTSRSTKASGGSTEKGDIKFQTVKLHIECKDYTTKTAYNEDWMQKCIDEVPFHSDKIPVLITRNKNGKIRAHMDFTDFVDMYKESIDE